MSKHIFITGYYGFENTGDEAILTAMVAHLRALMPDVRITATSAEPQQTSVTHDIGAILWSDTVAMVEAVRAADLVVIGGGGIFHDYWGFNPDALLTDNHSGTAFYTAPAVLAALYQKPVMLYAVGVGPLLSDYGKRFTKVACDAAHKITVRDPGSKDLLTAIGVASSKIEVTADPVFGFPLTARLPSEPKSGRRTFAVAVRHWDIGVDPRFWEAEVAKALDHLLQNEANSVELIPFQRLTGQEDDFTVACRLRALLRHSDRAAVIDDHLTPGQVLERIRACDLVIGMRLHSIIFGMIAGLPVVALSYDPKVDQVMQQMGLEQFCIALPSVDAQDLAGRIQAALEAPAAQWSNLHERTHLLSVRAARNADIAVGILRDEPTPAAVTPGVISLLRRTIETQLREAQALRAEERRLLKEVEFYIAESRGRSGQLLQNEANAAAERARHADQLRAIAAERDQALAECAQLQGECGQLRDQCAQLRDDAARSGDALCEAEDLRGEVVRAADRYRDALQQALLAYRNQKAWQVMLALRKGYTLLFRDGVGAFLKWVFTSPLLGPGNLAEYDLQFPNVWNYMPHRLEMSLLPDALPAGLPAAAERPAAPKTLAELLPQQKYDIVILAIFDFDFRFQRPQQIAAQFARNGHRVFWVSPGRYLEPGDTREYEAIALRENMWEVHLRGTRPDMYGGSLAPEQADAMQRSLSALYKDFAIAESCAILQFPFWRQAGLTLRNAFGTRVVYDCMDDWQNWTAEPRISAWNLEQERQLTREADVLVVTSQEFLERHRANGLSPVLARNAADFEAFASPRPNDLIAGKSKPVVGYYGAIADWFDLALVTRLAESRPQYSFVLIGQVHGVDTAHLAALPNVQLLGEKNYREIPLYLAHFDVCLIPFVLNKLTRGVDPVKMYEYFSQGKPVVATDMAELAESAGLLYISRNFEEFAANVDRAVAENDPELRRRRIEYARANTWTARVAEIDRAIREAFPKISILVVTYNAEEYLQACFESIERNTAWPNYEVIVVDNNSAEPARQVLQACAARNARIRLQLLDRNSGFAGGNNIAARDATGEYLVFLNPDTIVPAGWLGRMVRHCDRDSSIGAVAAVTNFSGNETKINFSYQDVTGMQKFASKLAAERAGQATDIRVAPLYCVLVPLAVWKDVGELDETFQVGMFEDDDFSLRIRNAGYRVVMAEDTFIHHFGNGSFAKIPSEEALRLFQRNKARYEEKWQTSWIPHQLRTGARSPFEEPRPAPAEFLSVAHVQRNGARPTLSLRKLHPGCCVAGAGFNVQPDGRAALVVECENATPGTAIVWDGRMLATTYGSPRLLTAVAPPELYAAPANIEIYLLNDFGESNRLPFVIEAHSLTSV